jgi:hypothetical protein
MDAENDVSRNGTIKIGSTDTTENISQDTRTISNTLILLLAGPPFQQCLNTSSASDYSPVSTPWSTGKYNKKNQSALTVPGVASF